MNTRNLDIGAKGKGESIIKTANVFGYALFEFFLVRHFEARATTWCLIVPPWIFGAASWAYERLVCI